MQIDDTLRRAWNEVYKGNSDDHNDLIRQYYNKYKQFIYQAEETYIKTITDHDLKRICQLVAASATGMDLWVPQEFSLLSDLAYDWLATLLGMIEAGSPWSKALRHVKAAALCKDSTRPMDPGPSQLQAVVGHTCFVQKMGICTFGPSLRVDIGMDNS